MITLRQYWDKEICSDDQDEFADWFLDVHIILQKMNAPSVLSLTGEDAFRPEDVEAAQARLMMSGENGDQTCSSREQ